MARVGQPAGQPQPVSAQLRVPRVDARRRSGRAKFILLGFVVIAAGQDVGRRGERGMLHREESRRGLLVRGQLAAGFLQGGPGGGVGRVRTQTGVLAGEAGRPRRGREPMEGCDLRTRQGLAPDLDLVQRAIAETRIARTRGDLEGVVARLGVQRVADDLGGHLATIEVEAQARGPRRAIIGAGDTAPGADRQFVDRLDRDGAVRPEVDQAPAQLAMVDEQLDAGGVTVAGVEARGVQDRRAGVLLTEAEERRERERVEAADLSEVGQDEAGITVELDRLALHAGHQLEILGRTATLELGGLAAGDGVIDPALRERLERQVHHRRRYRHGGGRGFGRRDGGQGSLGGRHRVAQATLLGAFLVGLEQTHERRRDLAMEGKQAVLVLVAEHRGQGEEVALGDGVVLMIVAAGALDRQSHEGVAGGHHAVVDTVLAELLGDRTTLECHAVQTVEGRGDPLVLGRVGQEIAGELFRQETVVGQVVVERAQDPVSPRPGEHPLVARVAPGVGVAREVHPGHGQVFAVARGGQQRIDLLLESVRGLVGQEGVDLRGGRRQTGQHQGDAAQPRRAVGRGVRAEAGGFGLGEDEAIERVLGPVGGLHRRGGVLLGADERPVRVVLRALRDPAREDVLLGRGERPVQLRRRHDLVGVRGVETRDDGAALQIARHDGRIAALQLLGRAREFIQTQAGLAALVGVGSVATETTIGEDGADVTVEVDEVGRGGDGAKEGQGEDGPSAAHGDETIQPHPRFLSTTTLRR